MSESSLPLFGRMRFRLFLKTLRRPRLKGALRRLYTRRRDAGAVLTPGLEARADRTVREHLNAYAENFERAVRLGKKAERLEEAGTPSESARNRAERAREEAVAGLAALRASFVDATRKGGRAFDRALERRCPAFASRQVPDGRLR
ncbi:MAG TPA: hypothetical protein VHF70_02465 [Rubrobacteraceae bacterium]|nr:hypothetical protein [Rubrobacteraceae bacterium]